MRNKYLAALLIPSQLVACSSTSSTKTNAIELFFKTC